MDGGAYRPVDEWCEVRYDDALPFVRRVSSTVF